MNARNQSATVATNQHGEMAETRRRPRRAFYPEQIAVRLPGGMLTGLDTASGLAHCSTGEYVRRALLQSLDRDGVALAPVEAGG